MDSLDPLVEREVVEESTEPTTELSVLRRDRLVPFSSKDLELVVMERIVLSLTTLQMEPIVALQLLSPEKPRDLLAATELDSAPPIQTELLVLREVEDLEGVVDLTLTLEVSSFTHFQVDLRPLLFQLNQPSQTLLLLQ